MDSQGKRVSIRLRKENTGPRIESEKKIVGLMIELYCNKKHEKKEKLCDSCKLIFDYAMERLSHCRFGEEKSTCQKCPVHCYRRDMKENIKIIMRFSGPRMMIYHPIEAFRHLMRNHQTSK